MAIRLLTEENAVEKVLGDYNDLIHRRMDVNKDDDERQESKVILLDIVNKSELDVDKLRESLLQIEGIKLEVINI